MAEVLKENTTLTTLNLGKNNIGVDGAKDLAEVLKENNTIITLNLNNNNIGPDLLNEFSFYLNRNNKILIENKFDLVNLNLLFDPKEVAFYLPGNFKDDSFNKSELNKNIEDFLKLRFNSKNLDPILDKLKGLLDDNELKLLMNYTLTGIYLNPGDENKIKVILKKLNLELKPYSEVLDKRPALMLQVRSGLYRVFPNFDNIDKEKKITEVIETEGILSKEASEIIFNFLYTNRLEFLNENNSSNNKIINRDIIQMLALNIPDYFQLTNTVRNRFMKQINEYTKTFDPARKLIFNFFKNRELIIPKKELKKSFFIIRKLQELYKKDEKMYEYFSFQDAFAEYIKKQDSIHKIILNYLKTGRLVIPKVYSTWDFLSQIEKLWIEVYDPLKTDDPFNFDEEYKQKESKLFKEKLKDLFYVS